VDGVKTVFFVLCVKWLFMGSAGRLDFEIRSQVRSKVCNSMAFVLSKLGKGKTVVVEGRQTA